VKVCVETYGCTMNQGEGVRLQRALSSLGHEVVERAVDAALVVLNTCTVIRETEKKMLKRMRELTAQRKQLVVSGCMAVVQQDDILKVAPEAIILPHDKYDDFLSIVRERYGGEFVPIAIKSQEITAIVPIAQGCLGTCTYCITKKARGTLRSLDPSAVVGSAKEALSQGSKEILLTAQDTGCYGFDRNIDLSKLLECIAGLPGEFMVRVGMMNPDSLQSILESLVPAWMNPKVYKFIHLPVQSGSDRMIASMGRGYTTEEFEAQVVTLRNAYPDMTLSTDVITGFPGETDEDHRRTVELIERVKPDILNVTRFSPRPGTPAAKAANQVVGWKSKERSRELTRLRFKISSRPNEGMLGRAERVLVTEGGKQGSVIARTPAYKPVVLHEALDLGQFVSVEIVGSAATHLFGRPL